MRRKSGRGKGSAERVVKDIRRATRRRFSAEEKIRIVLAGLRGEASLAEPCRREGSAQSLYYSWSQDFLEAGKKRLAGDRAREASTGEVKELRRRGRSQCRGSGRRAFEGHFGSEPVRPRHRGPGLVPGVTQA